MNNLMKKISYALLGAMTMASVVSATGVDNVSTVNTSVVSTTSQQGHLARIEQAGVLKVGMTGDYKPLSFYNKTTGQYEGIEVDLANSLASALGVKLEIVKTSWPTLLQDTKDGKFDVAMSGITRTNARQIETYQSKGYITFGKTALMRKADVKKYTTLESMNKPSVKIGLNPGGTNEKFVRQYLPKANIQMHNVNEEIPGLVANGTYDIMITDNLEALRYSKENSKLATPLVDNLFTKNQKVVLMQQDDALLNFVNNWLEQEELEGNIQKIVQKHM